jgi:hypothetical protein
MSLRSFLLRKPLPAPNRPTTTAHSPHQIGIVSGGAGGLVLGGKLGAQSSCQPVYSAPINNARAGRAFSLAV